MIQLKFVIINKNYSNQQLQQIEFLLMAQNKNIYLQKIKQNQLK